MPQLITSDEAAEILGVVTDSFYVIARQAKLRHRRHPTDPTRRAYRREDVEALNHECGFCQKRGGTVVEWDPLHLRLHPKCRRLLEARIQSVLDDRYNA